MSISPTEVLAALDGLAYRDRMRTLAGYARDLAAAGTLRDVVARLRHGDRYERFVALMMAVVARDGETVVAGTADPDRRIRATAVRSALRFGWLGDDEAVGLIEDAPADLRRVAYGALRTANRPDVTDRLIGTVRSRFGDVEAAALLPACGPDTVERLLPELDHAVNWTALARRHGGVLLAYAERTLPRLAVPDRRQWWIWRAEGVLALAAAEPTRVLDLLERYAPAGHLPGRLSRYGVLAQTDPVRVLRLLTAPARAQWLRYTVLPRALLARLSRLDPADLVVLGRRLRGVETAWTALLAAVPPSVRGTLYDLVTADVETVHSVPGEWLLRVLPWRWQEREARRILGLAAVRDDEAAVLRYTVYLPWAEAAPTLVAAIRRAEADDRAVGYELLLAAAGRGGDPAAVAAAVAHLARLRNEQDPVRARALAALHRLARLLPADSVEVLDGLVVDATQARDASPATLRALSDLATAVVGVHADDPTLVQWALRTLDRVFGGHRLPLGPLDATLRRGQEREVFAQVRPWIEAGITRGEFTPLFALARSLGRRAWRLPELQHLLGRVIDPGTVSPAVRQAVALWLDDPSQRDRRVERVLAVDLSTIALPEVWGIVSRRRTDLLGRVLLGPAPTGMFVTAGVRWVPGWAPGIERWLPRHQEAYADLQALVAADAGARTYDRTAAIAAAARTPGVGHTVVERYLDSPDVNLAEAALAALAWTDRPEEALPRLLAHADGDRARVAIYAAGRAARFIRPSRLVAALADTALGRGKVTSRKEALRLLARFGSPAAMDTLLAAWRREDQHRDVRVAVVSAARQRLELPQSWRILDEAVAGGREEVLAVLDAHPAAVAERYRSRYAALLVAACGNADRVVARAAWAGVPRWAQWAPDLGDRVVAALSDLDDRETWRAAAVGTAALLDHEASSPDVLGRAFRELVRLDTADADPGGPDRDRPARRRVAELTLRAAGWAAQSEPDVDRAPVRAAARVLAQTPDFVPSAAELLAGLVRLDAPGPDPLVGDLTDLAELTADRPVLAARLADVLAERIRNDDGRWEAETVASAARVLADRPDGPSAFMALALVRAGACFDWTPLWCGILHRLRAHPVADVRAAALAVVVEQPGGGLIPPRTASFPAR